jgi:chromosome partitioning protein
LIDLDPQAHATYGLGVDLDESELPTISEVLGEENLPLADILLDTTEENLKLAPSDIRLARTARLMDSRTFRESVLKKVIAKVEGFDYIIIDCQPTLDVLSINALVSADKILIPTQLAGHALKGLSDLLSTLESIKNGDPYDWRILLTMVTGHGEDRQAQAVRILDPIKDRILETRIPRTEAIERSQMESDSDEPLIPIVLSKTSNRGSQAYRALVKELLEKWPA